MRQANSHYHMPGVLRHWLLLGPTFGRLLLIVLCRLLPGASWGVGRESQASEVELRGIGDLWGRV
jgi:hypothetical protein